MLNTGQFTGLGWIVSVLECSQPVIDIPILSSDTDPSFPPINTSIYNSLHTKPQSNPRNCHCGSPAVTKSTSITPPKTFLTCAKNVCKYFRWTAHLVPYASVLSKAEWRLLPWRLLPPAGASARDIAQGRLGDCWFLSALAVASEDKFRFARLFQQRPGNFSVDVTLFVDGRLKRIPIDRKFPVLRDKCIFSSTVGNSSLWVSAAEKAYAKVNGSYSRISGGEISEGLFDIFGLPVETLYLHEHGNLDDLWTRLLSFKTSGCLMGCATSFARPENGIAPFHAYSLVDLCEVYGSQKLGRQTTLNDFFSSKHSTKHLSGPGEQVASEEVRFRLVKIRNPWGRFEWRGKWGSQCPQWTSDLAQRLGKTDKNDGVFFMEISDFVRHFHLVDVCKTHKDWHILSVQVTSPQLGLTLRVLQNTWLYVTTIKPSKRRHPKAPIFDLGIRLKRNSEVIARTSQSLDRLKTLETVLDAGDYELEFPCYMWRKNFAVQIYSAQPVMVKAEDDIPRSLNLGGLLLETFFISDALNLELRRVDGVFVIVAAEVFLFDQVPLRVRLLVQDQLFFVSGLKEYVSGKVTAEQGQSTSLVAVAVPKNGRCDIVVPFEIEVDLASDLNDPKRRKIVLSCCFIRAAPCSLHDS